MKAEAPSTTGCGCGRTCGEGLGNLVPPAGVFCFLQNMPVVLRPGALTVGAEQRTVPGGMEGDTEQG